MGKTAIVYWSGTGNTEAMAAAVAEGAKEAGAEVTSFEIGQFSADKMDEFDAVAFGCPAMGDEVLEEDEFQPVFDSCKAKLSGKKIGLFGSYGWGDGEWMRNWETECKEAGAVLVQEPVISNDAPDEEGLAACRDLGKALA
jgi:flavodoxin short chain